MFHLLDEGKRIINFDETKLPCLDFRTKKWNEKGMANTTPCKQLSQRVNMIAALGTQGKLYLSIT